MLSAVCSSTQIEDNILLLSSSCIVDMVSTWENGTCSVSFMFYASVPAVHAMTASTSATVGPHDPTQRAIVAYRFDFVHSCTAARNTNEMFNRIFKWSAANQQQMHSFRRVGFYNHQSHVWLGVFVMTARVLKLWPCLLKVCFKTPGWVRSILAVRDSRLCGACRGCDQIVMCTWTI